MMSRLTPFALAPALLLGACGGTYNGGVDSVYQPVVERHDYLLDLQTAGYDLAPGEAKRLAGWMAAMKLRYGDRIAVDTAADGRSVPEEVAEEAARYGLTLSDQAPITMGQIAPGTVRVVITRMSASVPGCPDFSRQYQPDFSASTSSNFGCSTSSNLAAMVADPGDLVRGADGTPTSDPNIAGKAVNALRNARPSGSGGTTLPQSGTGGQ